MPQVVAYSRAQNAFFDLRIDRELSAFEEVDFLGLMTRAVDVCRGKDIYLCLGL